MKKLWACLLAVVWVLSLGMAGAETVDLQAYLGDWYAIEVPLFGEQQNPADVLAEIKVTFTEDGKVLQEFNGEVVEESWTITEDGLEVDGETVTLMESGNLLVGDGVDWMVFSREKPESNVKPILPDGPYAGLLGDWYRIDAKDAEGEENPATSDTPVTLTVLESGMVTISAPDGNLTVPCVEKDDSLWLIGEPVVLQEDGKLRIGDGDTLAFFERVETAAE